MLGSALVTHERGHVRIEVIGAFVGPGGRRVVDAVAGGLTWAFTVLLMVAGLQFVGRTLFQHSASLGVPMWVVYAAVPAGAAIEAWFMLFPRPPRKTWSEGATCCSDTLPPSRDLLAPEIPMTIGLMLALFAGFLCLGVPIAHGMGLAAVLALIYEGQVPILLLAQRVYDALDNFSLLAVPLFIIAGELMNAGGITERLVAMSRAWIGHLRAGSPRRTS
jgi:hypothetical protein